MKISYNILWLIILSCIIFTCSQKKYREEIIERYPNGEKKIIVKYQGYGDNEKLIERKTFDENGELILLEDKINKIRKTYIDMHPSLKTKDGLLYYLQGEWDFGKIKNDTLYNKINAPFYLIKCDDDFVYKENNIENGEIIYEYKLEIKSSTHFNMFWNRDKPLHSFSGTKLEVFFKGDFVKKAIRQNI